MEKDEGGVYGVRGGRASDVSNLKSGRYMGLGYAELLCLIEVALFNDHRSVAHSARDVDQGVCK